MKRKIVDSACLILLVSGIQLTVSQAQAAAASDAYNSLLERYVRDGRVDYHGFKQAEAELDVYLEHLARIDVRKFSRAGQMASYINAYNACTIKLILDHFEDGEPVGSIKDIGGFFSKPWSIRF